MHMHHTPRPCSTCGSWPQYALHIDARLIDIDTKLNHLGALMTEVSDNQAHLDQDVAGIATAFAQAIAELKAQIAAGATPEQLDFTAADALVATVQGEATADAPAAPVETPPADDGSTPSA